MHLSSNNFWKWMTFCWEKRKPFWKKFEQKFEQKIWGTFFLSWYTSSHLWCYVNFGGYGWAGGGDGSGPKIQSCSEWPETHFGFEIWEFFFKLHNWLQTRQQFPTMHFGSNYFEFGWLFVLVGTPFVEKKNWKKVWTKNLKNIFCPYLPQA